MPERLRSDLIDVRQSNDKLCWRLADATAQLNAWQKANGIGATITEVSTTIAYVLDTGKSAFTIYNYYLVGLALPSVAARESYAVLPFSHLLHARRHAEETGTKITRWLNLDLRAMDKNHGSPISCEAFKALCDGRDIAQRGTEGVSMEFQMGDEGSGDVYDGLIKACTYIENTLGRMPADDINETVLIIRIGDLLSKTVTLLRQLLEHHSEIPVH